MRLCIIVSLYPIVRLCSVVRLSESHGEAMYAERLYTTVRLVFVVRPHITGDCQSWETVHHDKSVYHNATVGLYTIGGCRLWYDCIAC